VTMNSDNIIVPSSRLYRLRPTDNKLRIGGGLLGSSGEFSTYKILASYSLFEDMLFFRNDIFNGRTFVPLYDSGELFKLRGEMNVKVNDKISLEGTATYYNYKLDSQEYPWNKPSWEGTVDCKYNLRNKILATAGLYGVSKRYAEYGPMLISGLTEPTVNELPMHISLNLSLEYRYTKILSFWTRINNISTNRFYEWNFYPDQRFVFMAGFTYSL
jgi:hypothetical protein